MLTHLHIEDLAVIEKLDIQFVEGLNILTGETGAGKSILIKALSLILGARAGGEVIRKDADSTKIVAQFSLDKNHPIWELLREKGLLTESDDASPESPLIIRRLISKNRSKNQSWVQDTPVSVQTLQSCGELLIDILGQFDHHKLLNRKHHFFYLDAHLDDHDLFTKYTQQYSKTQAEFLALQAYARELREKTVNLDFLVFRLKELKDFAPTAEDYEDLLQKSRWLKNVQKLAEPFQTLRAIVDQDPGSLYDQMRILRVQVQKLGDFFGEDDAVISKALDGIQDHVADLSYCLEKYAHRFEDHAEVDIESVESRIAGYQSFFRKFQLQKGIEDLLNMEETLTKEVAGISNASQEVASKIISLHKEVTKLEDFGLALRAKRQTAAKIIASSVQKQLAELDMPGASFSVHIDSAQRKALSWEQPCELNESVKEKLAYCFEVMSEFGSTGGDDIEFFVRSNPGQDFHPLKDIASGGEISRIMLALKSILSSEAESCLLVFDEIDSGVSGRVADSMGRKIKHLAKNTQILCISHLPQVAAYADRHFLVSKNVIDGQVRTEIRSLNQKDSIEEIARLLSASDITAESRKLATDLKKKANLSL